MTLAGALSAATARGIERLDAQLLLLHALRRPQSDRAWLLAHDMDALPESAEAAYRELCERRAGAEPLAYIVGHKEFFGLELRVDSSVLVPRPETEILVEWALEILDCHCGLGSRNARGAQLSSAASPMPGLRYARTEASRSGPAPQSKAWIPGQARDDRPSVVDLGTGSGAIALAIKQARPQAVVNAVDSSPAALEVARGNADRLSLDVNFSQGSWLAGNDQRYDLIVANPPYVAEADPHLRDLGHEPIGALAAGPDGLRDIRIIIGQAPAHLRRGGWLMLEHGWNQAEAVRGLLRDSGLQGVATRRDLAGIERCSGGQRLELG